MSPKGNEMLSLTTHLCLSKLLYVIVMRQTQTKYNSLWVQPGFTTDMKSLRLVIFGFGFIDHQTVWLLSLSLCDDVNYTNRPVQWSAWGSENCREYVCSQINGSQTKCFGLFGESGDIFGYFLFLVIPLCLLVFWSSCPSVPFLSPAAFHHHLSLPWCFPLGVSLFEFQIIFYSG